MQQAVIYARARTAGNDISKGQTREDEEIVDLASERSKYQNFWIGVNRGIRMDSRNPYFIDEEISKTAKVEKGKSKNLFNPYGRFKLMWDGLVSFLVVYSIITIPMRIAFEPRVTEDAADFDQFILLIFGLDILATFNTSYIDHTTEALVLNREKIAMHYLKGWFWIDALSTFPFGYFANIAASSNKNLSALRAVRALRLFRILKLFRVSKFNETLQNLRINPHVVNLVLLILSIFFIAHVFACVWHFMSLFEVNRGNENTWVNELGYAAGDVYDRYVASLYYVMVTMMTIGYGDIRPASDNERVFAIITMLTGGVVFGAMISRLASILEKRNPEAKALAKNMTELKSFLVDIRLPLETRRRVVAAYFYYLTKKSSFGEPFFLEQLPQPIMYRVVKQMNEDDIRCVRLFHTYEMDFVVPLLLVIKPFLAAAGDVIYEEGDLCDSIVFVKKGKIALTSSNGYRKVLAGHVRSGGYFGDMEHLRKTTCIATYSAAKHSHLLAVPHSQVNYASNKCLEAGVRFRKENQVRYELFNQVLKENKKSVQKSVTQMNLDESRQVVDKLIREGMARRGSLTSPRGLSARGPFTPRVSASSIGSGRSSPTPDSGKAEKEDGLKLKRRTSIQAAADISSLWVDGTIIGSRNLTLLARNVQKALPLELEETMVRVIYVNPHGHIGPGEVPESYIARQGVIHPLNEYKVAWDLVVMVLIFFSVITVPIEVAFSQYLYLGSATTDKVIDSLFLLDLVLTFRTAYFDDGGDHLVIVPSRIAREYLATWFVPDLLGSLPIDSIVSAAYNSNANFTLARLFKVVRLLRLFKILRLLKIGYATEFMEDYLRLSPAVINLVTMLVQVFFVGHLVACILFGLSSVIARTPWWGRDVPTVHPVMDDASLFSQYILSLYWTFTIMSTVGYGDITPTTTPERLLNIFVILLGASMFGYMIANVSGLIQSLNSSDAVMTDKIAAITEYLDEKQCPHKLQDAVIKHFRNYYKHASPFDVDKMLARLPQRLANEILLIHHANTLKHIAVLKYIDNVSIRLYLFGLMHPVYYEPNEHIIEQGTAASEIFFLTEGKAVAFKKKEDPRNKQHSPLGRTRSRRGRTFSELSTLRSPSGKHKAPDVAKQTSPAGPGEGSAKRSPLVRQPSLYLPDGTPGTTKQLAEITKQPPLHMPRMNSYRGAGDDLTPVPPQGTARMPRMNSYGGTSGAYPSAALSRQASARMPRMSSYGGTGPDGPVREPSIEMLRARSSSLHLADGSHKRGSPFRQHSASSSSSSHTSPVREPSIEMMRARSSSLHLGEGSHNHASPVKQHSAHVARMNSAAARQRSASSTRHLSPVRENSGFFSDAEEGSCGPTSIRPASTDSVDAALLGDSIDYTTPVREPSVELYRAESTSSKLGGNGHSRRAANNVRFSSSHDSTEGSEAGGFLEPEAFMRSPSLDFDPSAGSTRARKRSDSSVRFAPPSVPAEPTVGNGVVSSTVPGVAPAAVERPAEPPVAESTAPTVQPTQGFMTDMLAEASSAASVALHALSHPLALLHGAAPLTAPPVERKEPSPPPPQPRSMDVDTRDLEPIMQSPPPPLPDRAHRFHFSVDLGYDVYGSDSDQEFADEYESLRKQVAPYARSNTERSFGEEDPPIAAQRSLTFAGGDKNLKPQDSYEESDSEEEGSNAALGDDGMLHKFDPTFYWTEPELRKRGLDLVGELSPGDFVGHLSLMHATVNLVTVVTAAYSTVYTLKKQEIAPLLSKQPTVSIHLQMALSRAISAQADVLGKFHMRQARSKFLSRRKEEFYEKLGVTPGEVRHIRQKMKNKVKRVASTIRGQVQAPRSGDGSPMLRSPSFYLSTGTSTTLNADFMASESARHGVEREENANAKVTMPTFTSMIRERSMGAAQSLAKRRAKVLTRRLTRKVKAVERVLTKYTTLYDSAGERVDDDDAIPATSAKHAKEARRRQKILAHRTPLPPTVALRLIAPEPVPSRAKRRNAGVFNSPLIQHAPSRSDILHRMLSRSHVDKAKDTKQLRRVSSFNDFDPAEEAIGGTDALGGPRGRDASQWVTRPREESVSVVPIYTNLRALRHESELRGRRQSFPSLDNDVWKVKNVSQGLL